MSVNMLYIKQLLVTSSFLKGQKPRGNTFDFPPIFPPTHSIYALIEKQTSDRRSCCEGCAMSMCTLSMFFGNPILAGYWTMQLLYPRPIILR